MAFDDLDLEFEDEEEQKKKKNDAVPVDVDLEFAAPEGVKSKPAPSPQPRPAASPPGPGAQAQPAPKPATVTPISAARPQTASVPRTAGTSALKEDVPLDLESASINEMREQMRRMEIDSQVKVQVAEFKTEYLSEMLSDMKLLEHQITQLATRIHAKHPEMKNEVLMIKKILADFVAKKRK